MLYILIIEIKQTNQPNERGIVMSDIAYRFFKEDKVPVGDGSVEDSILFFIDNYNEFLIMYRVMQAQLAETKKKQEMAHQQLQELRDRLDTMAKKKQELTEAQKIEYDARKEYLIKIREESDVVYYKGEPMETDKVANLLLKYEGMFTILERIDRNCRIGIASKGKKALSFILKPLQSCMKSFIKDTKDGEMKQGLKDIEDIVKNLPTDLEETIMSKVDVNLELHIPKQKEFVWEK